MAFDRIVLPPPPIVAEASGGTVRSFVSRAGHKLEAALAVFDIVPAGRVCADLGANVGGFTDCLLQHGATKVYAVDTAYGVLAWALRKDPRVVVRDRANALHVKLPEAVSLVAIDVGWTKQARILPAAGMLLAPDTGGDVLSLVKPHYESELAKAQRGVLNAAQSEEVLWQVIERMADIKLADGRGLEFKGVMRSPLEGQKGNVEYVAWLRPKAELHSE
jgi:23S rRNA (cytidine1920-2'-O)/16S rRNA (cytidine1409-2'-O)-methyltransferase